MMTRRTETMPFDKAFEVNGSEQLCHATGWKVCFGNPSDPTDWWNEYEDSEGNLHYGR